MSEKLTMKDISEAIKALPPKPKMKHDTLVIAPIAHKKGFIEKLLYRFGYIKGSTRAQVYKLDSHAFEYNGLINSALQSKTQDV
ncbi:MAG TPA: hypothetical protein ENI23_17110 [bacterium]|nr:hypothetical protein [bacterium]